MLPAYSARMAKAGNMPALRPRPAALRADFVNGPGESRTGLDKVEGKAM
jgi:hypothetical protein